MIIKYRATYETSKGHMGTYESEVDVVPWITSLEESRLVRQVAEVQGFYKILSVEIMEDGKWVMC